MTTFAANGSDTETSESCGRRDVPVELVNHRVFPVAPHHHLLFLQLLGHVLGRAARHVDPRLGEERARSKHKDDVEDGMDRVGYDVTERFRWRQVVAETTDRIGTGRATAANIGPHAEQVDEEVTVELDGQHLRNDVQVGYQGRLQNDRNIRGVEQLDRVAAVLATVAGRFDRQIDTESLEVYDHREHEHRRQQVHQVGQILAVEGFAQGAHLILARGEQVEQRDHGTLELGTTSRVYRGRRERLPHDRLTDVGRNEEGNTGTETVALLQQLVEQQHDQTSHEQLDDDKQAHASADFRRITVHSRHYVHDRLADCDDHAEQLLGTVEECAILRRITDFDDFRTSQQLHDQARRDDRRDTELH
uniref:Uncharacterized protein n=1 Tax=Anopheles albimanus TaxID=7167 RepID=A0A182F0P3_ANOAL